MKSSLTQQWRRRRRSCGTYPWREDSDRAGDDSGHYSTNNARGTSTFKYLARLSSEPGALILTCFNGFRSFCSSGGQPELSSVRRIIIIILQSHNVNSRGISQRLLSFTCPTFQGAAGARRAVTFRLRTNCIDWSHGSRERSLGKTSVNKNPAAQVINQAGLRGYGAADVLCWMPSPSQGGLC